MDPGDQSDVSQVARTSHFPLGKKRRIICPDVVCRSNGRWFDCGYEWLQHLVAVHHFHFMGLSPENSLRPTRLEDHVFTSLNELDEWTEGGGAIRGWKRKSMDDKGSEEEESEGDEEMDYVGRQSEAETHACEARLWKTYKEGVQ